MVGHKKSWKRPDRKDWKDGRLIIRKVSGRADAEFESSSSREKFSTFLKTQAASRVVGSRYGKARVRVAQVVRGADGVHALRELSVDVLAEGDFAASFLEGDNALVLPTDTMKNTIYVLAGAARDRERGGVRRAGGAFLPGAQSGDAPRGADPARNPLGAADGRWAAASARLPGPGFGPPMARVAVSAGGRRATEEVESGIDDLCVLKTTGSGFRSFIGR